VLGKEIHNLIHKQTHPLGQEHIYFLFGNESFLCRRQEYAAGILLELTETVTEFGVPGQPLKPAVLSAVMSMHSLIDQDCEIEADKEGSSIGS
jgi:hypothetical protein